MADSGDYIALYSYMIYFYGAGFQGDNSSPSIGGGGPSYGASVLEQPGPGKNSAGQLLYQMQYGIPVWGACKQFGDNINRGNYWAATVNFVQVFIEAFSLGYGTELRLGTGTVQIGAQYVGRGVTNAGEMLGNFGIPKFYTYTSGGRSVFVSPQAMKHLEELATNGAKLGPDYLKFLGQTYQKALQSSIDDVLSSGAIQYNKMYYSGGNEIMFGAPRSAGELPAVIHFR
jgi:filamentous hemagglutinin